MAAQPLRPLEPRVLNGCSVQDDSGHLFCLAMGWKKCVVSKSFQKKIWQLCHVAIQFPQPSLTSKSIWTYVFYVLFFNQKPASSKPFHFTINQSAQNLVNPCFFFFFKPMTCWSPVDPSVDVQKNKPTRLRHAGPWFRSGARPSGDQSLGRGGVTTVTTGWFGPLEEVL